MKKDSIYLNKYLPKGLYWLLPLLTIGSYFAINTSFTPNNLGWVFGFVIALFIITIYVIEVIFLGDNCLPNFKLYPLRVKFLLTFLLLFFSIANGVYVGGWLENRWFGKSVDMPVKIHLKGSAGRRYQSCGTTAHVSTILIGDNPKRICLSKSDFRYLEKKLPTEVLAKFQVSKFGISFINIIK